jgi:acetoin utilization protein AcuB
MNALQFIDPELKALHRGQTAQEALHRMQQTELQDLPLVEDGRFVGMLHDDDILDHPGHFPIGELASGELISVRGNAPFFQVWSRLIEHHLSSIAVLDEQDQYLGCIRLQTLVQVYTNRFTSDPTGCLLVLSQRKMDYSLRKIASLVEDLDCIILSSFVTETSDTDRILITVKINCQDPQSILQALERYGIDVLQVFSEETYSDLMKERFNMLMSYLNL